MGSSSDESIRRCDGRQYGDAAFRQNFWRLVIFRHSTIKNIIVFLWFTARLLCNNNNIIFADVSNFDTKIWPNLTHKLTQLRSISGVGLYTFDTAMVDCPFALKTQVRYINYEFKFGILWPWPSTCELRKLIICHIAWDRHKHKKWNFFEFICSLHVTLT